MSIKEVTTNAREFWNTFMKELEEIETLTLEQLELLDSEEYPECLKPRVRPTIVSYNDSDEEWDGSPDLDW